MAVDGMWMQSCPLRSGVEGTEIPLLRWERLLHRSVLTGQWEVCWWRGTGKTERGSPTNPASPPHFSPSSLQGPVLPSREWVWSLILIPVEEQDLRCSKIPGSGIFEHSVLHDVFISTREALNSCPSSSP